MLSPTGPDLWVAEELLGFLKLHPLFDIAVQSMIRHNILGGLWFGAALFICWIQCTRRGESKIQLRIWTILIGSTLAVLLTLLGAALISWPPPSRYPPFQNLFPNYFDPSFSSNSFPSQSTALYGSVAAGIYSIHKASGWVLWVMVAVLVALPRMYVGGHYLTDVVVGVLLALAGYAAARYLLEAKLTSKIPAFFENNPGMHYVREFLIFFWILQVSVEYREMVWAKLVIRSLLS